MKYDKAYSELFEECLTIYEVRELNFDENSDYNSDQDNFYCPDNQCRLMKDKQAVLTTVNANKVKYKKTPHFKDTPSTVHIKSCPYLADESSIVYVDPKSAKEEGTKTTEFPIVFLLERKKYSKKEKSETNDFLVEDDPKLKEKTRSTTGVQGGKKSPNTTSVFEHIVEGFLSKRNNNESLKDMPLSIGGVTANYNYFFKKIRFFQDREGLIYWGRVKKIKDYVHSFSIEFEDRVSNIKITAYLDKNTIQNYYKKKYFTDKLRSLISEGDKVDCFFLGAYPKLKKVNAGEKEFDVYNIDITNLDHFLLRVIE